MPRVTCLVSRFSLVLTCVALLPAAQQAAQRPRLRASVDLVVLDVYVRDAHGRTMSDLDASAFQVIENGQLQQVQMFAVAEDVPVDAVLLVDRSTSVSGDKDVQARTAARAFAATLRPGDRLEVLGFDKRVSVLRELAPLSRGVRLAAWRAPRGETALFDAVAVATHRISRRGGDPARREVLLLLSDGEDTSSILDESAVLPRLRRSGAVLYAVRLEAGTVGPLPWWLRQFAADTGGEATAIPEPTQLPAWFTHVGEEIRTLYRIGYVSSDTRRDGAWRTVHVRVAGAASVRTRAGYYAPDGDDLPARR